MRILLKALFCFGGFGIQKLASDSMNMEDLGLGTWDSVFCAFAALHREVSGI
jgi:hypothetical protein